ncbi:MAG: M56 family metallopeptidase, partial [Planctomycetales bacterium]|nr:M56 family metallopeptidase [Planctomycetales bacterium]
MNEWIGFIIGRLLATSTFLLGAVVVAQTIIVIFRPRSSRAYCLLWGLVLTQGIVFLQVPIQLSTTKAIAPVLNGVPTVNTTSPVATGVDRTAHPEPHVASHEGAPREWLGYLSSTAATAWLLGIVIILVRWVMAYCHFLRIAECPRCDIAMWNSEASDLCRTHGIRRHVNIHVSANIGPVLYWHPTGHRIVVPHKMWGSLSEMQRRTILRHELSHLERHDIVKLLIASCVALLHWFNPLA